MAGKLKTTWEVYISYSPGGGVRGARLWWWGSLILHSNSIAGSAHPSSDVLPVQYTYNIIIYDIVAVN